jgi:hypothetical protein
MALDQAGAQTVLQAAKESAQQRNAPSAIAVVDPAGDLLAFQRSAFAPALRYPFASFALPVRRPCRPRSSAPVRKAPGWDRPAGVLRRKHPISKVWFNTVFIDDNFDYQNESERVTHGVFETADEALAACRHIVDEFLIDALLQLRRSTIGYANPTSKVGR